MQVTAAQLKAIASVSDKQIGIFLPYINKYAAAYQVTTVKRMAMFLAQVLHESGCLKYTREMWGPTETQKTYERDMSAKWGEGLKSTDRNRKAYMLGNVNPGDGKAFAGHGLIQVTGRTNHFKCSYDLFKDDRLIKTPELLTTPEFAVLSAYWFWGRNNLNTLADGADPLLACTKRINGGTNGIAERKKYYEAGLKALA
ncbi:MAG: glycoside hydrolase family 19 protein [Sphingobacteriales bacterium]|nr:MAG: glycoside hydrolase family 19 protein [Sphingobacteriales bacterium]